MIRRENRIEITHWRKWLAVFSALIMFLAFQMKYDEIDFSGSAYRDFVANLLDSFQEFHISDIIIFPLLYVFAVKAMSIVQKMERKWTAALPAFGFSLFMLFGYSFEQTDTWSLVRHIGNGQLLKTLLIGTGYFLLFFYGIVCIYYYAELADFIRDTDPTGTCLSVIERKNPVGWYIAKFAAYPFRMSALTLFVIYIPYAVIFYPGIFCGDTYSQVVQAYKELHTSGIYYMSNDLLMSQDMFINQHHPVLHTVLIHMFLVIGTRMFHSVNAGIYMYCIFQWMVCVAVISYGISVLVKEIKVPLKYALVAILYFIVSPRIQNYMFLVTKDVFYGMSFILVMIGFFRLIRGEADGTCRSRDYILLAVSSVCMVLFRNEAVYILAPAFLLSACFCRQIKKVMCFYAVGVLVFSLMVFKVLFPALSITPGSVREMLAVPFQQTARYVTEFAHEVTEEERDAIAAILNYEKMAEKYDPNNVDNVKATYNEHASREELAAYFKVWFRMFLKHPNIYVQATMNNYYRYFYPGPTQLSANNSDWSEECMELTNGTIAPLGLEFSYPERFREIRTNYEFFRSKLDALPVYNMLVNPALYVWVIMLCAFYCLKKGNLKALALLMVPCCMILIRLVGPCNGQYCRYMYPLMVAMPYIVPMVFSLINMSQKHLCSNE